MGLPGGWARRARSDGQPSKTSTVRASPTGGPTGSANPIQKANSSGNNARTSTAPARRRCHSNHPAAASTAQTSKNNTNRGTVVSIPMFSNGPPP